MKQESKELIDWIKKQINLAKENCIDVTWNGKHEYYNTDYEKAMNFLDSLPQIEQHLCFDCTNKLSPHCYLYQAFQILKYRQPALY